jgi:hypothetical protein
MLRLYSGGKKLHHSKFHVRYSIFLQEAWQSYYSQITDLRSIGFRLHRQQAKTCPIPDKLKNHQPVLLEKRDCILCGDTICILDARDFSKYSRRRSAC